MVYVFARLFVTFIFYIILLLGIAPAVICMILTLAFFVS